MQASTPTAMPSLQQVETSVAQAPVPVSQMLSVQQVEAQQAAQQLLQGQQQSPPPAADSRAFGSVQGGVPVSSQRDSTEDDASSQVRQAPATAAYCKLPVQSCHTAESLSDNVMTSCCACAYTVAYLGPQESSNSPAVTRTVSCCLMTFDDIRACH